MLYFIIVISATAVPIDTIIDLALSRSLSLTLFLSPRSLSLSLSHSLSHSLSLSVSFSFSLSLSLSLNYASTTSSCIMPRRLCPSLGCEASVVRTNSRPRKSLRHRP